MKRDVSADRHERGGGERWTWRARETIAPETDGEVVGSWHPGADVSVTREARYRENGGKKAGPRGDLV